MSDQEPQSQTPEPTAEELEEMFADLDFFFSLEEAEALPLEEPVAQLEEEDDHE